jgi:hypothetical protein
MDICTDTTHTPMERKKNQGNGRECWKVLYRDAPRMHYKGGDKDMANNTQHLTRKEGGGVHLVPRGLVGGRESFARLLWGSFRPIITIRVTVLI